MGATVSINQHTLKIINYIKQSIIEQNQTSNALPSTNESTTTVKKYRTHTIADNMRDKIFENMCLVMQQFVRHDTIIDIKDITNFARWCTSVAEWDYEIELLATILIVKWSLITGNKFTHTWKFLFFLSLVVTQKAYNDVPVNNASMLNVWLYLCPDSTISTQQFNESEIRFLKELNYAVIIPDKIYKKILFELEEF